MLCVFLWPSVLGGVTLLRNVLVPGIFFPISWKGVKLLVTFVKMSPYIFTITPSPMSRIFPTVCGQNPRWRRMLLCSRSTPFQPVHRRLPRPATRRLRTPGKGRRSKTGAEVYPKVRGITIKTSTAIEQSGRPPQTIIKSRSRRYHLQKSALQKEAEGTLLTNLKQFTRVSWSVPRQIIKYCLSPTRCSGYIY